MGDIAQCLPAAEIIQQIAGKSLYDLMVQWGWITPGGSFTWYEQVQGEVGKDTSIWGKLSAIILDSAAWAEKAIYEILIWMQKGMAYGSGCNTPDVSTAALVQGLIGVVRKYVAEIPESLTRPWDYYSNWACPVGLPHADWACEALAHDAITKDQWTCLIRADGQARDWQSIDVFLRQTKLSDDEYLSLLRRGKIGKAEYDQFLKWNGRTDPILADLWSTSQDWIPTPTDAVQWMLKDISDPQVTGTFGLFNEFNQKYTGDAKAAFDWNGMSEQMARDTWAAHWRNMAPHTLYEMHKRLRPGRVEEMSDAEALQLAQAIAPRRPIGPGAQAEIESVSQFLEQQAQLGVLYGSDPQWAQKGYPRIPPYWLDEIRSPLLARAYLANQVTTGFHVYEALGQSDFPPFWRARLLAISYNVMTRVDIRRAYETGQIDLPSLVSKLQDRGYSPGDAKVLGGFFHEAAVQLAARRPTANSWVNVGFDETLLRQSLIDNGMRADMWPDVQRRLQTRRKILIQTKCLNQWKKEFVRKLYTEGEMYIRLTGIGLTHEQATQLISDWTCERTATHRQVMAAEACRMMRQGVINSVNFTERLRDLGYRPKDIRRMLASCGAATPSPRKAVPIVPPEPTIPAE
jgi:hypothetical protein